MVNVRHYIAEVKVPLERGGPLNSIIECCPFLNQAVSRYCAATAACFTHLNDLRDIKVYGNSNVLRLRLVR